jgi:hypothetical protein
MLQKYDVWSIYSILQFCGNFQNWRVQWNLKKQDSSFTSMTLNK